jgi:hypothetical protein
MRPSSLVVGIDDYIGIGTENDLDGHDKIHIESFLLGHFEPNGPGTRERIVDDEVFG